MIKLKRISQWQVRALELEKMLDFYKNQMPPQKYDEIREEILYLYKSHTEEYRRAKSWLILNQIENLIV